MDVNGDEAVLRTPPGEIARYYARELSELIAALSAARAELHRREA